MSLTPEMEMAIKTMALQVDSLKTETATLRAKLAERAERMQTMRLAPRSQYDMPEAQSVGYFSGDLPALVIEVHGRLHELELGQSIPVRGKTYRVCNPFARTADVSIMINAAPQLIASARGEEWTRQKGFVTYNRTLTFNGDQPGENQGLGLMLTSGRAVVHIESSQRFFADVYPSVPSDWATSQPAGSLEDTFTVQHVSGDVLPGLTAISGYYDNAHKVTWEAATGYTAANKVEDLSQALAQTYVLETGNAIFFNRANTHSLVTVTLRDLGDVSAFGRE